MTDDRNWDELADEESEWGDPSEIPPAEKVESVVSVRLPASMMNQVRANARERGLPVSAYLRELVARGLSHTPSAEGAVIDIPTRYVDGSLRPRTETSVDVATGQLRVS